MASRMERYRDKAVKSSRSSRNKNLYNTIYSYDKYSNIEGIASIDKSNEIDISKVKEMIDSREKYQNERKYRKSTSESYEDLPVVRSHYKEDTERNYDIMDVLKTAKENKEPDNKERVLNDTNYDVLKKLNLKAKFEQDEYEEDDLKELIETIANTSMLNKVDDGEMALDMFKDLASDDTKVGDVKDIKEFTSLEKTMDDSFFTGGLKLKKADFVSGSKKKGSTFKTIFVTFLILAFITGVICLVLYYFNII